MQRKGAPRGKVQRGNGVTYEVGSGQSYRPGVNLPAAEAEKLVTAARVLDCSVSFLIQQLVARMEVDPQGRPSWYPKPEALQEKLIA